MVQERAERGSAANRRLRAAGLVPGILYGRELESRAFSVPELDLRHALTGEHGSHAIIDVTIAGEKTSQPSILKDYQRHAGRGGLLHVDLQIVRLDEPIHAVVAITLVGEAIGEKVGGVVTTLARELNVQALPAEVPDEITVDVSALEIGDSIHLSAITPPKGVTFLDDAELPLVIVNAPLRASDIEAMDAAEAAEAAGGEVAPAPESAPSDSEPAPE